MYAGEIIEYGTVEEVFNNHRHPYTDGLFNSIPDIDSDQSQLSVIEGLAPDPTNIPTGCSFHPRCPYAMEQCSEEVPLVFYVNDSHYVRCHKCGFTTKEAVE